MIKKFKVIRVIPNERIIPNNYENYMIVLNKVKL